jgi:uncharacterized protein (TIGR03382 family)
MRVLVAAAVFVLGAEGVAFACGREPELEPPGPLCNTLSVYAPGSEFPVDLAATSLRVTVDRSDGEASSPIEDAFPLAKPIQVFRQTDTGYEPAPYELETGGNLVKGARTLHLTDPKPAHYVIAWEGETCNAQPSPAGGGMLEKELTLTPSVPLPATPGTAKASSSGTKGRDFQEGVGGDCRPIMVHVDEAKVAFTLTPSPELLPWADAITTALEIDGKIEIGFAKPQPEVVRAGQHAIEITRTCGASSPSYVKSPGLAEGTHKARLMVAVDGQKPIGSPEVTFDLHCDASAVSENGYVPTVDGGYAKAPEHDGCNASGKSASSTFLFLVLGAVVAIARRARAAVRGSGA